MTSAPTAANAPAIANPASHLRRANLVIESQPTLRLIGAAVTT